MLRQRLAAWIQASAQSWADWVGDRHLDVAITKELRKQGYAVHASQTRNVRLVAIQRPGWIQVRRFSVETLDAHKQPITLQGLARDDGRKERIDVLLSTSHTEIAKQLNVWGEGLIRRG